MKEDLPDPPGADDAVVELRLQYASAYDLEPDELIARHGADTTFRELLVRAITERFRDAERAAGGGSMTPEQIAWVRHESTLLVALDEGAWFETGRDREWQQVLARGVELALGHNPFPDVVIDRSPPDPGVVLTRIASHLRVAQSQIRSCVAVLLRDDEREVPDRARIEKILMRSLEWADDLVSRRGSTPIS